MDRVLENVPMPATYFKVVLDLLGTTSLRREALLDGTGVAVDARGRVVGDVTTGQLLRQLRNAHRVSPAGWGLAVGARLESATHGFVGFGAVSAPTLGAALDLLERFTSVRNPTFEGRSERRGSEYALVFRPRQDLLEEERIPLVETYFLSVQAIAEAVLGRPVEEGRVEVTGRPPHFRLYRDFFHADVRFEADRDALVLPETLLDHPSMLADREMYEAALRKLEELAERLVGDRVIAARVAALLESGGDAGLPMEAAARKLGLSPRTLIRRLNTSGSSYRQLRDSHRRRRAEVLLRSTELTMGEIAARLGYEDPSNFARACHRWFGCAPGAYRDGLRQPRPGRGASTGFSESS